MIIGILFVLGLVVGSFLNVVIYRTTRGESFVKGRSVCPKCKNKIPWHDNIPLLSFLILKGKCRKCKTKISWRYPAIEFLTGALFVWWYGVGFAFFQLTQKPLLIIQPVFWLIVGLMLLIIFTTDWFFQIIPDYAVIILGCLSLIYRLYLSINGSMRWEDFWAAMWAGLVMVLIIGGLWWFTKGKGMGFGDVKYALVMGWLLGWQRSLVALFLAFVMGALVGVILIWMRIMKMKDKIAFGPFLVLGTVIGLLWGNGLFKWYMSFW